MRPKKYLAPFVYSRISAGRTVLAGESDRVIRESCRLHWMSPTDSRSLWILYIGRVDPFEGILLGVRDGPDHLIWLLPQSCIKLEQDSQDIMDLRRRRLSIFMGA